MAEIGDLPGPIRAGIYTLATQIVIEERIAGRIDRLAMPERVGTIISSLTAFVVAQLEGGTTIVQWSPGDPVPDGFVERNGELFGP